LKRLRVMVVDDTIVYRKIVSDIVSALPDVEVVGTAGNGKIALSKIATLKPDLITLDIQMPEMDGLQVLARLKKEAPHVGAIMLSNMTHEGRELTIKALELGAFDVLPKPELGTVADNGAAVKIRLTPMLKAYNRRHEIKQILNGKVEVDSDDTDLVYSGIKETDDLVHRMNAISGKIRLNKSEVVAIGVSTGGPKALAMMMPHMPPNLGVPILIVQHMPPVFTASLAKSLGKKCPLQVQEARDGDTLSPNTVFIAPGGKQMKISSDENGRERRINLTDDPPENSCRPSVDYLFRSVAEHYSDRATGVIMTGMGSDGTEGIRLLKENGSFIIAQDEATCTVFGMPKETIEAGRADVVSPLGNMVQEIISTVKRVSL